MIDWLRDVFSRRATSIPTTPPPPPAPELAAARARHRELLTRADVAIQAAMSHADEVFGPTTYTGRERRARPR